jgi:hypothetical protein
MLEYDENLPFAQQPKIFQLFLRPEIAWETQEYIDKITPLSKEDYLKISCWRKCES